ncbi:MHYT domain-containing protein [Vulcaniibacterium tengchongense]|uniref:NO-binding membrane sensor protein with MHYT domain n=1 Tax=Vulcaniibacterium tengchongense TaxID=1273429 RepID=A0A3N4W445_9GAMM|nr:MHYT domain-containing protein [Vulcaniibacterium tengchongense]RPE79994.1 NO-binding membrane sensor protein with MHYT domain [Vulcaniibacterium tengchongense]
MPHEHAVQCVHDPLLVALSYLVSVLGSFTALQLAVAIPAARDARQRWRAIVAAGAAMGGGAIWAMHFIAMIACKMDIPVSYHVGLTVLSALIAMVSCMAGLAIASAGVFGWGKLVVAGLFMGLGVTGMHYSGMAAMLMPATTHYDTGLVVASGAIAVAASIAALWLAFNLRGWLQMFGSALVMGVAVCGMHYTGMAASRFVPDGSGAAPAGGLSGAHLGLSIFLVTSVLLAAVLAISLVRQRQRAMVQI